MKYHTWYELPPPPMNEYNAIFLFRDNLYCFLAKDQSKRIILNLTIQSVIHETDNYSQVEIIIFNGDGTI